VARALPAPPRRRQDQADNEVFREQARAARAAVAARKAGIDQTGLVQAAPEELTEHIKQVAKQPAPAGYLAEGWEVMSVDLTRVCSLQPTVHSEQAIARVANVDADDVTAVAAITLPLTVSEED